MYYCKELCIRHDLLFLVLGAHIVRGKVPRCYDSRVTMATAGLGFFLTCGENFAQN